MKKGPTSTWRQALALCFAFFFFTVAISPVLQSTFKIHGLIGYNLPHGQLDYGYLYGLMFRANQF